MNLEVQNGDRKTDIDIHPESYAYVDSAGKDAFFDWNDLSEPKRAQLMAIHERAQELAQEAARVLTS